MRIDTVTVLRSLPAHLFAPVGPIPPTLRDDLRAIASGDLTAVERVLASTGKLVGTVEAKHELPGFIEALLVPDDDPTSFPETDAVELIESVARGAIAPTDCDRAIRALIAALGPHIVDLIFQGDARMDAQEIYEAATRRPSQGARVAPRIAALHAARRALVSMAIAGDIELPFGESAALKLAAVIDRELTEESISHWAELGEVFAEDVVLAARVRSAIRDLQ